MNEVSRDGERVLPGHAVTYENIQRKLPSILNGDMHNRPLYLLHLVAAFIKGWLGRHV